MTQLIFLLFLLAPDEFTNPPPSGGKLSEAQAAFDTKQVSLVLEVFPEQKQISGYAELELFFPGEQPKILELDLMESLKVSSVTTGNRSLDFRQDPAKLWVDLPPNLGKRATFRVIYAGHPQEARRPPWEGGFNWSTTDAGQPWIGVSTQGYGGKLWFPCKAHPSDKIEGLRLQITVPQPLYCAANGQLEKMTLKPGKRRTFFWTYDEPISNYNVSLNIAPYRIKEDSYKSVNGREFPLFFYFLTEYQKADQVRGDSRSYDQKIADLIQQTKDYLAFFERHYGPYPFTTFKVAHTHYLGMEHQTINSYGNHFVSDKRQGKDFLLFHEMAHEWWGNRVTVKDWADFWIHEGIGTYATPVWIEEQLGIEAARTWFRDTARRGVANRKPLVPGRDVNAKENYGGDIYYKGALVLHSLRYLLGKEKLNAILRTFATDPAFLFPNHPTTQDFIALAEKETGRELDWFFDVYFKRAKPPKLEVTSEVDLLRFRWDHKDFAMPLEVEVVEEGQKRLEKVRFAGGRGEIEFKSGSTYKIDPHLWVYMEVVDKVQGGDAGQKKTREKEKKQP